MSNSDMIVFYIVSGVVSLTFVSAAFEIYLNSQRAGREEKSPAVKLRINRLTLGWSILVSMTPLTATTIWWSMSAKWPIDHPVAGILIVAFLLLDPIVLFSQILSEARRTLVFDRESKRLEAESEGITQSINLDSNTLWITEYYPNRWRMPGSGHPVLVFEDGGSKIIVSSLIYNSYDLFDDFFRDPRYQRVKRQFNIIGIREF